MDLNSVDDKQESGSGGEQMEISSGLESFDESENEPNGETPGNMAWADAMSRVLGSAPKASNFILSKAKKDADIKPKPKAKELELVDDSGNVIQTKTPKKEEVKKSYSKRRKEMLEKLRLKAEWESMCRVKPDITQKERERELVRIATRGVVHLFNTVEQHQKSVKVSKKKAKDKKANVKGSFMDMLKIGSKKVEDDPAVKKTKQEETWSILKDDFMMGAEMKDWDKESDAEI